MGISFIHNFAIKLLRLLLNSDTKYEQAKGCCQTSNSTAFSPAEMNYTQTGLSQTEEIYRFTFWVFWYQIFLSVKRIGMHLGSIQKIGTSTHAKIIVTRTSAYRPIRYYVRLLVSGHLPAHEAFIECYNLHTEDNFADKN